MRAAGKEWTSPAVTSHEAQHDSLERRGAASAAVGLPDVAVAAGLAGVAAALRVAPLGPPSLYLDDSWPALVVTADSLHEVLLAGAWAPGFIVLLKGWITALGFSELNAQLLPFLFGIAAPPLLYLVLRWRNLGRLASGAGAVVLLTSSVHIAYSARVKQYTLDALCVVVLLAVLWWLLDDVRDARRWRWLVLATVITVALSSPTAVVAGPGIAVAVVALLREDRRRVATGLVPAALVALFSGAWWWFVLRPRVTSTVQEDFRARFFGVDEGFHSAVSDFAGAAAVVVRGAVEQPDATEAFVVLAAAAVVLWRRTQLGFLLLAPLALAAVLAASEVAPLGTGRTDIYLYPLLAALMAVAVQEGLTHFPRATTVAAVALGTLSFATFSPASYPQEEVRPLVRVVEARGGQDAVLVYPKTRYPFALYTTWPVDLLESSESQTGFTVRVRRPNVFILENLGVAGGGRTIERLSRRYETVWVLVSHGSPSRRIERLLGVHGYDETSTRRETGAMLVRWSKEP